MNIIYHSLINVSCISKFAYKIYLTHFLMKLFEILVRYYFDIAIFIGNGRFVLILVTV